MCSADIFLGVLAILFPPFAVWVRRGICSVDSVINILLSMLGFLPGLLHAWYIIAKYPEPAYEYESLPQHVQGGVEGGGAGGRVTYVFVDSQPDRHAAAINHSQYPPQPQQPQQQQQTPRPPQQAPSKSSGHPQAPPRYGTTDAGPPVPDAPPAGSSSSHGAVPPSYDEAMGDNKVQTRD